LSDLLTTAALRRAVEELGYELVDVSIVGKPPRQIVRMRIDRIGGSAPGAGVTTEDCQRVSRALERQLEDAGVVSGSWTMEVSSPGIERPVRFPEHWRRFIGSRVRLKLTGGRGRSEGRIVAVPDDETVVLEIDGSEVAVPLETIREATLVIDWSALLGGNAGES
jgi:ribosome maturation factor RimP